MKPYFAACLSWRQVDISNQADLEVLVPGLLGPVPLDAVPSNPAQSLQTTVLDRLLSRGRLLAGGEADLERSLLMRFGAEASAPYVLAVDAPDWDRQGFWWHADPVHLRADRDRLRLFDAPFLAITQDEADALVAAFNAHFAEDGLVLWAPTPSRWYLRTEQPPQLETTALRQAVGQAINGLLPTGPDARRWAGLMNEAQMLFFQSPVNQARERAGRPVISGVWPWGGGDWRALSPPADSLVLMADLPLARGLAEAAGIHCHPLERPSVERLAPTVKILMIDEAPEAALRQQDLSAWWSAIECLDQRLQPWLQQLRAGRLASIHLNACDARAWRVQRRDLKRFWRRIRPLRDWVVLPGT